MYKVLIVEDEPVELEALAKMVGGYEAQVGDVLLAKDGYEALRLARAETPDIMIVDVNIPGISGLEALTTLRGEGYAGEAVIVTAYSQFDYAQTALRANVADYLLKPVDDAELDRCLKKVFTRLEAAWRDRRDMSDLRRRVLDIATCLQPMVLEALMKGRAPESSLRTLFNWPPDGQLQAFALSMDFETELSPDEQNCLYYDLYNLYAFQFSLIASTGERRILMAIQPSQAMPSAQVELLMWCCARRTLQITRARGHGCRVRAGGMYTHYGEFALFPMESQSFQGELALPLKALLNVPAFSAREIEIRRSKALMRLKAGEPEKAASAFKPLFSDAVYKWAGLYHLFNALLIFDPQIDVLDAYKAVCRSGCAPTVAASAWMEKNAPVSGAGRESSSTSFIISQALEIIDNRYMDDALSQADIARQLGLSQAYFSRLFKKEAGETFIARLTKTRLRRARELLKEGLPVSLVAKQCGYQSKKYFLDAFRQNVGLSVTQYLNREEDGR
ncbi:MAG: response regulator [Clostridia bacterium]|nr:response regulator [Clostridia bacterium]